jgi:hypothetical protein
MNNNMELSDFMVKFLPDYRKRYEASNPYRLRSWESDFIEENFPEALQNFADMICERQRKNCNDEAAAVEYMTSIYKKPEIAVSNVLSAIQPKIDEL